MQEMNLNSENLNQNLEILGGIENTIKCIINK